MTQEHGVLDAVAKGARKAGSRFAGCSEPLSACRFELAQGKRSAFVTQAQPITSFPGIREDYNKLCAGLALCELAEAILPHEQEAGDEFRFMLMALGFLEVHENPLVCLSWAEAKLMQMSGFQPEFLRCVVTGAPLKAGSVHVSVAAGGFVGFDSAARYPDAILISHEVLVGAGKILEQERPPANMKHARQVFMLQQRFWRSMAEHDLPANRQFAAQE